MPAKGGRRLNRAQMPWHRRPALVERVKTAYRLKEALKTPVEEIAQRLGVSVPTVYDDLVRARELARMYGARDIEVTRYEAVVKREGVQEMAVEDRALAQQDDASGKAQLLKVYSDNQTAIEELSGVRMKDQLPQTSMTVVVLPATGEQKAIVEMSEDELLRLSQGLEVKDAREVGEARPDAEDGQYREVDGRASSPAGEAELS